MIKKAKKAAASEEIDLGIMSGVPAQVRSAGELVTVTDSPKELNQLQLSEWIGQRKFSAALQKLLTVSDLVELQKIKETKSYKGVTTQVVTSRPDVLLSKAGLRP